MALWSYPEGYKTLLFVRSLGNFCFYGLKSVLILYLTFRFLLTDQQAFHLYGTFMALAYLAPVLGGWLSDQFFGLQKSILMGGALMATGCFLLGIPYGNSSYSGLALVSMGLGFFKPNTMSAVGALFSGKDSQTRDGAHTFLYAMMNLGSLLGPLVCGWIGQRYGWRFVFLFLGASILGASLFFHFYFKGKGIFKPLESEKERSVVLSLGAVVFSIGGLFLLLLYAEEIKWLMPSIILGSMGCLGFIIFKTEGQERNNILQIGVLMVLFAIFASVFEQTGSSLLLFIERGVDKVLFDGFILPSPVFQSLNPALVIGIGPLVAGLWVHLEHRGYSICIFGKFALGFLLVGISFVFLGLGAQGFSGALLSPLWMLVFFFLQVLGELCIVPIGFSAVSKLAPKKFMTMIMGLWMVSISCGHYVASLLAALSPSPLTGEDGSRSVDFEKYGDFFLEISIIPFAAFLLIGIGFLHHRYCASQKG